MSPAFFCMKNGFSSQVKYSETKAHLTEVYAGFNKGKYHILCANCNKAVPITSDTYEIKCPYYQKIKVK